MAGRIERGEAVTAPGVPKDYPNAAALVMEDCIRPAGQQRAQRAQAAEGEAGAFCGDANGARGEAR